MNSLLLVVGGARRPTAALILLAVLLANDVCALSAATPPFAATLTPSASASASASSAAASASASLDVLGQMQLVHDQEIKRGKDEFQAQSPLLDNSSITKKQWTDDDELFARHEIGRGNAGTDATYLDNGDTIFESLQPIMTTEECQAIIQEARAIIDKGLAEAAKNTEDTGGRSRTNAQLGEARLSTMPHTKKWLQETLPSRFFPLLESRFGMDASNLVLYDGLVLRAQAPSRSQPIHRDASLLTLNVALSPLDDFDGGGTYIEALDSTLKIGQGNLLCHAGGAMHAGLGITRGERWVLVLFVLSETQPQMARRCHAQALEYQQTNQLQEAEACLRAGLEIAPNDHLLHNTLARLYIARNNNNNNEKRAAFQSFQRADHSYPICQKAMVSMAQILMEQRRPRAALRRLDMVLQRIHDRDLQPEAQLSLKSLAWAARKDAARCALLCANYLSKQQEQQDSNNDSSKSWSCEHLPRAIDRLQTCLGAAPNDTTCREMLDTAKYLLAKAKAKGEEASDDTAP